MTAPATPGQHASEDDPRVLLDDDAGHYEPIPPYPPRTEREAEFYTLRDGEMFLNMGPQHPSTHGVLRVVLKISGERVVDLDPVLGYLHRGVEKLCENADYHQVISQVDPLEYVSSLFCEWSPVMAFEKLLDVEVPRRAEYIRVLTGELNRIASHALFMGWMALDLGGLTPILYSFIERDEICEMLASVTGQRMLFNYFRIGGVNGDINHEFMSRLGDWMSRATEQHNANTLLLNENEIFVRRMRDIGRLDSETRAADGRHRPEPAGGRHPVRHPPGAPVLGLPRARVRHPDPGPRPQRRRRARPLPAARRGDQAEPADHRPVPAQHARRAGHGEAAETAPAAARPGVGRDRGAARPVRDLRDLGRHRPAVPDEDPRPVVRAPPARRSPDARTT